MQHQFAAGCPQGLRRTTARATKSRTSRLGGRINDPHILPPFPQCTDPDCGALLSFDILDIQQFVLLPKSQEVRKERIEVRFRTEVQNLDVMCVVYMGEDAQQLPVHVFRSRRECRREVATYSRVSRERPRRHASRTRFCRERVLVVKQVLHPRHHIIDVCRCRQLHMLAICVDPRVIEPATQSAPQTTPGHKITTDDGPADIAGHVCCVQHSDTTP